MSNRVLIRLGARELTVDEMDRIAGGACFLTVCGAPPHFSQDDVGCAPGINLINQSSNAAMLCGPPAALFWC